MKTFTQKISYTIISTLWKLLSFIPLPIMYVLSDGLYLILYYLVRYRRKITRKNLTSSFPEKSEKEIKKIEKGFYHFFVDYVWETCKLMTISTKRIKQRMVFKDIDEVNRLLNEGKSISLYLGHYCNWEWISSIALYLPKNAIGGQIYHKIYNPPINKLFLVNRSRFGVENIEMKETLRWINNHQCSKRPTIVGYIADQAPVWNSIHYWVNFLHHNTPVFTGTERITKKYKFEAFYIDVKRLKRGYYEARLIKMHNNPSSLSDFKLTDIYYSLLEESINRQPEFYLWSHNRFKRTQEGYQKYLEEKHHKNSI